MKQKTILQHLNRLPECVRKDVICEFKRQKINLDYKIVSFIPHSLSSFLFIISWHVSELGNCFYDSLYHELLYHEQHNLKLPR